MINFQTVKLENVLDKLIDYRGKTPKKTKYGIPLVTAKIIKDGVIQEPKEFIAEADYDSWMRRGIPQIGDVLLTTEAPLGEVAQISNPRIALAQRVITLRGKEGVLNNDFLKYFLISPLGQMRLKKRGTGTTVSGIKQAELRKLEVDIPDFSTQTNIASVIRIYDKLIENNEKRIKILEEMAQRLYTEWFVKFKFPGHEKVKMVDSGTEFGLIPEGWEIVPLSKVANFMNGYPFKPEHLGQFGLPIVKIPELRDGILDKTPRNSGENIPNKYLINNGDILFSWSATLLINIWNSGNALLNQHLFKVTPKEIIYKSYTFYSLKKLIEKISKQVVGATMQHLRKDTVEGAKILLPEKEVLGQYESIASQYLEAIGNLNKQNQNLQQIRDLLIPQLVTGKRELKS